MKKFLKLVESVNTRLTTGGLLVGDVVKLVKNIKTTDFYKKCENEAVCKAIDDLCTTDKNIRVVAIKPKYPSSQPGTTENRSGEFWAEVAVEIAPGYCDLQNRITICGNCVEPCSSYPNLPDVPDSFKRKEKINIKPKPVEEDEESAPYAQTRKTQQGDKLAASDTSLPTKNVTLKESYTSMYMPKE